MAESKCRACARAIFWTTSPAGATLPLDARPVQIYTITQTEKGPRAMKVELVAGPVYVSHFLTCPAAREFSRGGGTP